MSDQIINIKDVSFHYGDRVVLNHINLNVQKGDFLGILGPNGSGKTTLLKIMLGLLKPTAGAVTLFGTPLDEFKERHRIGYVSQKSNSFNSGFPATVHEVVSMGLTGKKGFFKPLNQLDHRQICHALAQVGMDEYKDQMIGRLSGGQQQRVFIAKALVAEPDVLLFDEPTVGVDHHSMESFYEILEELHLQQQKTIILVSHDIGVVSTKVNRVACLNRELYFHGDNNEFIEKQDEILANLYKHSIQVVDHSH